MVNEKSQTNDNFMNYDSLCSYAREKMQQHMTHFICPVTGWHTGQFSQALSAPQ